MSCISKYILLHQFFKKIVQQKVKKGVWLRLKQLDKDNELQHRNSRHAWRETENFIFYKNVYLQNASFYPVLRKPEYFLVGFIDENPWEWSQKPGRLSQNLKQKLSHPEQNSVWSVRFWTRSSRFWQPEGYEEENKETKTFELIKNPKGDDVIRITLECDRSISIKHNNIEYKRVLTDLPDKPLRIVFYLEVGYIKIESYGE